MKEFRSFGIHLLEFFIAGLIFTVVVFLGLYAFNFKIVSGGGDNGSKESACDPPDRQILTNTWEEKPIISTTLPSQDELIQNFFSARRVQKNKVTPRVLAPWEQQVQDLSRQSLPPAEKVRQLLALANTVSGNEQARVYAVASSSAPPALFQQQLYPVIWNANTPAPVARILATGVVTQPDAFKFPALLSLLKHPDEEVRAMSESILWAYFPDEPASNYPQAVQSFLSGTY